mgnify:FL=1
MGFGEEEKKTFDFTIREAFKLNLKIERKKRRW